MWRYNNLRPGPRAACLPKSCSQDDSKADRGGGAASTGVAGRRGVKATGPPTALVAGERDLTDSWAKGAHGPHGPGAHTAPPRKGARRRIEEGQPEGGESKGGRRSSGGAVEVPCHSQGLLPLPGTVQAWAVTAGPCVAWRGSVQHRGPPSGQGTVTAFSVTPRRGSSLACPCAFGKRHTVFPTTKANASRNAGARSTPQPQDVEPANGQ